MGRRVEVGLGPRCWLGHWKNKVVIYWEDPILGMNWEVCFGHRKFGMPVR